MNDIINVLIEHGAEFAILDPALRKVGAGGKALITNWVGPERLKTMQDIFDCAAKKLRSRGAEAVQPPLSILVPLLEAAQDESREELKDLWASLLAAAADPKRMGLFRRDFIEIVKQMEPIDAASLQLLANMTGGHSPNRVQWVAQRLSVTDDQVIISFAKLSGLKLVSSISPNEYHPNIEVLGRLLMQILKE